MNQTTTSLPRRSPQVLALLLTTLLLLPRPGAAAVVSYYKAALRWVLRLLVGVGMAATAQAQTTTFAFTGSPQTYTVPAGVTQLRVVATGAGGGGASMFNGKGARVEAFVAVTPGEVLTVVVGGEGSLPGGGYNGGGSGGPTTGSDPTGYGGGGATDLRRLPANGSTGDYLTTRNALLVAGGGGGAAGAAASYPGGNGGVPNGGGGYGTSPTGGGATTTGPGGGGPAGSGGQGGAGSPNNSGLSGGNGGGGGGYYGGGGGLGNFNYSSGGGGGSSYVLPLAGSSLVGYSLAAAPGDGELSLTPFAGVVFLFTGAPQTYTVPAGVTRLLVEATGASGGRRNDRTDGGLGVRAQAIVTVVPGEVLTVVVGGQGGNVATAGYNGGGSGSGPSGGGGGGATDLRRLPANGSTGDYLTTRNALLVAGGGGGAAGAATNNPGGSGGVPDGSAGLPAARGGQGATTTAPGAGSGAGSSGSTSSGGAGGGTGSGGGGGGGYYGGGGGSGSPLGGGGGGSSLVLPTGASNISYTLAPVADDGLLTITPLAAPTLTSLSPATGPVGTSITLTGTNLTGTTSITFAGTSNNTVTTGFTVNAAGTSITGVVVPTGATTGNVTVTADGGTSNGRSFTVTTAPIVATSAATGITPTAATLNGTVSSDGGRAVTSRGFSYGTSATLAGASSQTVSGTTGAYSFNLSGLLPATTYYFRATATNALGTSQGSILSFMTSALPVTPTPTVTAPANGSSTNDPTPTYQGTAPAGSTVTIYLAAGSNAAQALGTTTATGGSFSFTSATVLASGSYSVYATAQSAGANVSANSSPIAFTVDATAPTVVSSNRQSPAQATTNASTLTFRVAFSEAVQGVTTGSFMLTAGGSASGTLASVQAVSGSTTQFDVTVGGAGGSGTLRLDVKSTGSGISDAVSNPLGGGYASGQRYTVDQTAPTVTGLASANGASGSSTSTSPLAFTVTFSEAVTGFSASDITVGNGAVSSGPTASGGPSFSFSVTPITAGSATTVAIAAGAAQDAAGNPSAASASYTLTFVPSVVTPAPVTLPNGVVGTAYSQVLTATGGTAPYTFAVTSGTLPAGLTLTNGTLAGTPTASGPFSFTVTATDAAPAPGPFSGARFYSVTIEYPDLFISSSQSVPAGTYHNITVLSGGTGTLAGNLTVNSSVTVQSGGVLNDGCFVLSGPGSFTLAAGGTLGICSPAGISSSGSTGAVQVTGTRTFGADALYTYNGSAAQVTGSGLPATVRALTLSNSAGLTLTDDVTATSAVALAGGVLRTGSNVLTLGPAATLSEDADGYATGTVQTTRTLSTAGTTQSFGGLGLALTPSGATLPGSTLVVRTTGAARTGAGTSQSVKRVFDIQPTVRTGLNVALTLTVRDDERNNIPAANLRLFKSDNAGTTWQPQKAATFATTAASGGQPTTYTASLSGISNFSLWTLGNAANPLPVELTQFTAQAQGTSALLRWTTASETNNAGFEVESSADGTTFARLGTVAGAGSSAQPHSYAFTDEHVARYAAPLVYYRLKQVDLAGTASYSPVRTVALTGAADGLSLYPNPAVGHAATLRGTAPGALVTVYDALGRPVASATADAAGTAALMLPAGLPTGVYVVRVGSKALRLVVE